MSDKADKQEQKPPAPPSQPEPTTPDPGNIEIRSLDPDKLDKRRRG